MKELLILAEQMLKEQDTIAKAAVSLKEIEYETGTYRGIDRIVKLIERQIPRNEKCEHKKSYKVTITLDNKGVLNLKRINKGFNDYELLGLLSHVIEEIHSMLRNSAKNKINSDIKIVVKEPEEDEL